MKLTIIEKNALWYVCGYICRKVRDKCEVYDEPLKGEVAHAIMQLAGDEVYEEGTEDWVNRVDRGGLWHVNDDVYDLFEEFKCLAFEGHKRWHEWCKLQAKSILADEAVKFKWLLLSCEMSEQAASLLFSKMLCLFITVRGFAFTSGCIEFYKQRHKGNPSKEESTSKTDKLTGDIILIDN